MNPEDERFDIFDGTRADKDSQELPPGTTGIELLVKDPLGRGETNLLRFFSITDNMELCRSVIVDQRPKDGSQTDEEYER
ncbi:MAG: hypothetical protein ACD_28C00141G0004 [uncultured bacterium]|nr:MAG: hypothetical protein ACD_28C00141G0004 [uncultured bacterium]